MSNKNYFGNLFTNADAGGTITSDPIDLKQQNKMSIQVVFNPDPTGIEVLVEFSLLPAAGTWSLEYNGENTGNIDAEEDATAVENLLQGSVTGFEDCTVTGNYTDGFTIFISMQQAEYAEDGPLVSDTVNLRDEFSVPVVITVGDPTDGPDQTIEGSIQVQVSNDNGRNSQTNTISVTNWINYSIPVAVDTSVASIDTIIVAPALGNWYRIVYDADDGEGTATANFSAKA